MVSFKGWVISQANEEEEYSSYFGKELGGQISRNWAVTHFDGWPQNVRVRQVGMSLSLPMCCHKPILRLKV